MIESTFLRISRAGNLERHICLQMAEGHTYRFAKDHTYMEVPLWKMLNGDGEITEKASRNQYIELVSAASVKLQLGTKLLVQPNPLLNKFGIVPSLVLNVEEERQILTVPITLRKDLRWDPQDWLIRVYMMR